MSYEIKRGIAMEIAEAERAVLRVHLEYLNRKMNAWLREAVWE